MSARDSLETGQAVRDIFRGNDWWSLNRSDHPENVNGFESMIDKQTKGVPQVHQKILNLDPKFKMAGKATLESATLIKKFSHYKIPLNSPLRKIGILLGNLYGIEGGGNDFNGNKAPDIGIGASF